MILHSDQEGNDCIWKLQCHCIQILHSEIYSDLSNWKNLSLSTIAAHLRAAALIETQHFFSKGHSHKEDSRS